MTNDQTVTQALEPCPFCGAGDVNPNGICSYSKGHEAWWADGTEIRESFFVSCVKCGISNRGMFGHRTRELAITAWNTRTAHSGEGRGHPLSRYVQHLPACKLKMRMGGRCDCGLSDLRHSSEGRSNGAGEDARYFAHPHIAEPARRVIERIADAVTTMQREARTADELGEEIAKECLPLFEQLGMSNEGDGWGFDEDLFGNDDRDFLFHLRWDADRRAMERWRAGDELPRCGELRPLLGDVLGFLRIADFGAAPALAKRLTAELEETKPGNRDHVAPDHADLVVWLLGELATHQGEVERLREALVEHFPTGIRGLYEQSAQRIPVQTHVGTNCLCGWCTSATDEHEVRDEWAAHVAAALAQPEAGGER